MKKLWQLFIFIELELFFYYFYDNQVTGSESCKIKIGIAGPIFKPYKISKPLWDNNIHTKKGEKFVAIINIYGARAIFLLFCDNQDTESESR